MLRTKIVCTIGPATRSPQTLRRMIEAGMNMARLNFSHGDQSFHGENIRRIRAAARDLDQPVAILTDLQGPKLRIGDVHGDGVRIIEGQDVALTIRPIEGRPGQIPVQYPRLPQDTVPGDRILIDDGLLELRVLSTAETEVLCRVVVGGLLKSNKGLNLPRASLSTPAITDKDRRDLQFVLDQGVDWIGLSFVRHANEVLELKELIRRHVADDERPPLVIAKIEKPEAVERIDAIIAAADAVMVARGDLGIETSPEEVPMVQKMIIRKSNRYGRPVITATQMLDSMIRNPRPTRAEASDVANAILDGTDAIMLSGETAIGEYPLESIRTMVKIAHQAERGADHPLPHPPADSIAEAVSHAAHDTAEELGATAIITPTVSGSTARMVSKYRPAMPIIAVTPSAVCRRQLALVWGVYPLKARRAEETDAMIADAVAVAESEGYVELGDVVVITAGAAGYAPGTTNVMKVEVIRRVLAQGVGVGQGRSFGRSRIVEGVRPADLSLDRESIVVTRSTDDAFRGVLEGVAGLITAEGGLDSHAAALALELGIPAVVGVDHALQVFHDGQEITIDAALGQIYEGHVRAT